MSNVIEIVNRVRSNPHLVYLGLIAALVIIIILMTNSCRSKDYELEKFKQNVAALQDTVRQERNKAGEIEYARLLVVAEKDELERLNGDLFKEMKKMRGEVIALSKVTIEMKGVLEGMKVKPDPANPVVLKDDTLTVPFNFDSVGNGWSRRISGKTVTHLKNITDSTYAVPVFNYLDLDRMRMTIYPGIRRRDSDGKIEYTVRTDYPGVSFDIQGYVDPSELTSFTEKKEDTWIIGPYFGLGLGATNTQIQGSDGVLFGPNLSIGIGVMYKIIGF